MGINGTGVGRKIVIFGASGNTGAYLAKAFLKSGWIVHGTGRRPSTLSHDNYTYHRFDVRDVAGFASLPGEAQVVVNLAGVQPSIMPPDLLGDNWIEVDEYLSANIIGTWNIMKWVGQVQPETYVYANSHRELENHWGDGRRLSADLPISINVGGDHAVYAITKTTGALLGQLGGLQAGVRVFSFRLPMMFLVPDSPFYLVKGTPQQMPYLTLIRRARAGDALEVWGDPQLARDYVHVENFFRIINLALQSNLPGGNFNVGTGEGVSTKEFVESIAHRFARSRRVSELVFRPEKHTYKRAVYDTGIEREQLGYEPILLPEMLDRLHHSLHEEQAFSKWGWDK